MHARVGVTKPVASILLFSLFVQNTTYILIIMFQISANEIQSSNANEI